MNNLSYRTISNFVHSIGNRDVQKLIEISLLSSFQENQLVVMGAFYQSVNARDGFSRGIFKNFRKFSRTFFWSTKLIFRALPKHCFVPILAKVSAPQAKFGKCRPKKAFLGTFWKLRFFSARSPLKISTYWRQRRL